MWERRGRRGVTVEVGKGGDKEGNIEWKKLLLWEMLLSRLEAEMFEKENDCGKDSEKGG